MAVTFPDNVHPKYGLELRFGYTHRATQYLQYFNITTSYPEHRFIPLNLTFGTLEELQQFLYNKGILRDEVELAAYSTEYSEPVTIVSTRKIIETDETISNYLMNYKYYSVNEVSEMLSFSRPTVYKIIKEGKIKTYRINEQIRIKHSDLMDYINVENTS